MGEKLPFHRTDPTVPRFYGVLFVPGTNFLRTALANTAVAPECGSILIKRLALFLATPTPRAVTQSFVPAAGAACQAQRTCAEASRQVRLIVAQW